MSSSNDRNKALVVYKGSALPAEQNNNTFFLKEFQAKINLYELIFRGLYKDQECYNVFYELVNFLIRNNQMLLAESIMDLLLSNKLTVDYRRHILKEMIYFVKAGQMNAFYDFCYKNISLIIHVRNLVEHKLSDYVQNNR